MALSSHERVFDNQKETLFGSKQIQGTCEWLTPPEIIKSLGDFDLDPCSPMQRPWDTAKKHYTIIENGLKQDWGGAEIRMWLNPPYGNETEKWMEKLAMHGNGIALIFARTETKTFFPWVWDYADSILFIKGRICFYTKQGIKGQSAGAPSCLIAYGENNTEALEKSGIQGKLILLGNTKINMTEEQILKSNQQGGFW